MKQAGTSSDDRDDAVVHPELSTREDSAESTEATREELDNGSLSFEVVLRSAADTSIGRQVLLQIGTHGLTIRDPYGAILKVVPIEYVTGWKRKEEGLLLLISKDLEAFYKLYAETDDPETIEAALSYYAEARLESSPPSRASMRQSRSSFGRARASTLGLSSLFGKRSSLNLGALFRTRGPSMEDFPSGVEDRASVDVSSMRSELTSTSDAKGSDEGAVESVGV